MGIDLDPEDDGLVSGDDTDNRDNEDGVLTLPKLTGGPGRRGVSDIYEITINGE